MNSRTTINLFLGNKNLAISGVSRNPQKFGNMLFRTLKGKGFQIFPINPNAESIDGDTCYHSVNDLPAEVSNLLIANNKSWIWSLVVESRFPVGSSAKMSFGSRSKARARATRCCSPPDNSPGRCKLRWSSPTSSRRARARVSHSRFERP